MAPLFGLSTELPFDQESVSGMNYDLATGDGVASGSREGREVDDIVGKATTAGLTSFMSLVKAYNTIIYDADFSIFISLVIFACVIGVAFILTYKIRDRRQDPNQEFVVFLYDTKKIRNPEPPLNYTFPEPPKANTSFGEENALPQA